MQQTRYVINIWIWWWRIMMHRGVSGLFAAGMQLPLQCGLSLLSSQAPKLFQRSCKATRPVSPRHREFSPGMCQARRKTLWLIIWPGSELACPKLTNILGLSTAPSIIKVNYSLDSQSGSLIFVETCSSFNIWEWYVLPSVPQTHAQQVMPIIVLWGEFIAIALSIS